MFGSVRKSAKSFGRNERGGVAIMFGLTAIGMIGFIGLAVDGSRAFGAKTKAIAALDAAALAATRAIIEGENDEDAVNEIAHRVFLSNVENTGSLNADYPNFDTDIDFGSKTVRTSVVAHTPTMLGGMFGVDEISVPASVTATFNVRDIELGIQLDLTGSMCFPFGQPCTTGPKIDALKQATKNLIDDLMPDGHLNRVRIGFAPFSIGVNAGAYVNDVSGPGANDGCVYERAMGDLDSDDAPTDGLMLNHSDLGVGANRCPNASSSVVALTDDKDLLKDTVDGYEARGGTAGHLGTAWAWYLVSPKWTGIWPEASAPVDYDAANTLKATVLMTDGVYNTFNAVGNAGDSQQHARDLCTNMKNSGVIVYSILFMENDPTAIDILESCATVDPNTGNRNFFLATNPAELQQAFRDIAYRLTALRLAQ